MNSPKIEKTVGLFVLGGIACLVYFAFQFGSANFSKTETYRVDARFSNIGGLTSGAAVVIAGVPVGNVGKMTLADDYSALVEMRIRKGLKIPSDSIASIRGRGLLGDKYVSLSPGAADDFLKEGARITDTESAIDLESLLSRFAFGSVQSEKKETPKP